MQKLDDLPDFISIHAPPRGATWPNSSRWTNRLEISIHAPPRGATLAALFRLMRVIFQFTPLREGRLSGPVMVSPALLFQFTPLREGRRA